LQSPRRSIAADGAPPASQPVELPGAGLGHANGCEMFVGL